MEDVLNELREIKKLLRIIAQNTEQPQFHTVEQVAEPIQLCSGCIIREIKKGLRGDAKDCQEN